MQRSHVRMLDKIQEIDELILFYLQNNIKNPMLDRIMMFLSSLGNNGFLWIMTALLLVIFKRSRKCGICLLCSVYLAMLLGDGILKPLFGRVRPCNVFLQVKLLLPAPHTPSFPSGHTMVGFAAAKILSYYNNPGGYAAYVLAALIAFSRMYLFVHYPSDILGGIIFGTLNSILVLSVINSFNENDTLPV